MSVIAFAGDITVTGSGRGVIITKKGENWGDPWPVADSSIEVSDVDSLIKALQAVRDAKSYDRW